MLQSSSATGAAAARQSLIVIDVATGQVAASVDLCPGEAGQTVQVNGLPPARYQFVIFAQSARDGSVTPYVRTLTIAPIASQNPTATAPWTVRSSTCAPSP